MHILKRPRGDTYTFRLFVKLIHEFKTPHDAFYMWSACIDPNHKRLSHVIGNFEYYDNEIVYRNMLMNNIKKDIVVIGMKDHLTSADFNLWTQEKPDIVSYLDEMFNYYHDKKFILFTSMENLDAYITNPNVRLIPWGGDIVNHKESYEKLTVDIQKDFNSPYTFLSLNRSVRHHRVMLVSMLYGLGLDSHGLISCMFKNIVYAVPSKYVPWQFNNEQQSIKTLIDQGFKKLKSSKMIINDSAETHGCADNANVSNFKGSLINYYQQVFVEIITETSYTEQAFNLTEKTLHSIYGKCFPILISSAGTVKFLREMGMDMFDDIIDHSYDSIHNPIDRMYRAITDNIDLLVNEHRTKQLWQENTQRFNKNIDFAQQSMYNFYTDRTIKKFHDAINI